MNRLPPENRARILGLLVEGSSLLAVTRQMGCSINTVTKLLIDVGRAAAAYHDATVRNLNPRRIECEEIWAFGGTKRKNTAPEQRTALFGDAWTWVALDADTKLCMSYLVGGRDPVWAFEFMRDVSGRVRTRVRLTTDGYKAYLDAVEGAFGMDLDFATLHKVYGAVSEEDQRRHSSARHVGCSSPVISNPDPEHVSTSFAERRNFAHAVALHFLHYNFARIHKTLCVTPAVKAGISDHAWALEEIAALPDRMATSAVA